MATLSEVAEQAGVSPTLVSRYLNNRIELPSATRERIDAAIARLDYRPNLLAKRLSTGKTEAIGLVMPEIAIPSSPSLPRRSRTRQSGTAIPSTSRRPAGDRAREVDCAPPAARPACRRPHHDDQHSPTTEPSQRCIGSA